MADWTAIPDASLDPDAPLTSELAYAWRDNPVAITEGAAGAPKITHSALMSPSAGAAIQYGSAVSVTSTRPSTGIAPTVIDVVKMQPIKSGTVRISVVVSGDSGSVSVFSAGSIVGSWSANGSYVIASAPFTPGAPVSVSVVCTSPSSGDSKSAQVSIFGSTDAVLGRA